MTPMKATFILAILALSSYGYATTDSPTLLPGEAAYCWNTGTAPYPTVVVTEQDGNPATFFLTAISDSSEWIREDVIKIKQPLFFAGALTTLFIDLHQVISNNPLAYSGRLRTQEGVWPYHCIIPVSAD